MSAQSLTPTPAPDQGTLPALLHGVHSVADSLAAAFHDPQLASNILPNLLAAILFAVLVWGLIRAWRLGTALVNRMLMGLGAVKGLRRFAVSAYLRQIRERHGTVRNIYLEQEETLDLR